MERSHVNLLQHEEDAVRIFRYSSGLREQCKVGLATGTMPISEEAQKAVDETSKCHEHIAKLKLKLPKMRQNLENQAQAMDGIREAREKQAIREEVLKEQITKAQQTQQQIDDDLQTDLQKLEEYVQKQKKMYVEAAKNRRELQENTITETQKQLAQLEYDTETFCADLKR